ncbi:hypothetical protein GOBAR_DD28058 [Gossypium barbadense]|nr:hypothetical protein GOBAR_DD28058 [Gossypium barbadense]
MTIPFSAKHKQQIVEWFKTNCKTWASVGGGKQNLCLKAMKNRNGNLPMMPQYLLKLPSLVWKILNIHKSSNRSMGTWCTFFRAEAETVQRYNLGVHSIGTWTICKSWNKIRMKRKSCLKTSRALLSLRGAFGSIRTKFYLKVLLQMLWQLLKQHINCHSIWKSPRPPRKQ